MEAKPTYNSKKKNDDKNDYSVDRNLIKNLNTEQCMEERQNEEVFSMYFMLTAFEGNDIIF